MNLRLLRRAGVAVCALACAALVAGCSSPFSREAPVKQVYLLDPPMPPAVAKSKPASVRVGLVNVASPFRGRSLVYRAGGLRYETDFYVEFLVAPTAMFTEQTSRALSASKVFANVVPPGSGADSDFSLDGFVSTLYADAHDGNPDAADLTITYYLTPVGAGPLPTWSREYHKHVDLATHTPAAYVQALNQEFGEILAELTRDLAALEIPKP
jgi:cholesterol transport system auxiliary component